MCRSATLLSIIAVLGMAAACTDGNRETSDSVTDDAEHGDIVKQDLFAVITLQGAPCGGVVDYEVRGELDYIAICETGNRYRVHVSTEGNVNVDVHSSDGDAVP